MPGERYTGGLRGSGVRVGKRVRQGATALTDIKNQGNALVEEMAQEYKKYFLDVCDARARSTYYEFVLGDKSNQDGVDNYLDEDTLCGYYPTTLRAANEFVNARNSIFRTGLSLIDETDITIEAYSDASKSILDESYDLVRTLRSMNAAKSKPPIVVSQLSGPVKIGLQRFFDGIGDEKPESFRETLRRDMPRFLWHPIPFPEDTVPVERVSEVSQLWNGYTSLDADNLIHSDRLSEGNAPLHMALKAAQTIEKGGDLDLGYAIKTTTILQLLDMERGKLQQDTFPEIPFFTYVLGGIMTGDIKKPPKNAHFNYQSALHETITQTGKRLTDELKNGEEGPATAFIQKLLQYYPDNLPQLLAYSFGSPNAVHDIDILQLMKYLPTHNQPWAAQLQESIFILPQRRILTNDELIQVSNLLPAYEPREYATQLHEDIKKL